MYIHVIFQDFNCIKKNKQSSCVAHNCLLILIFAITDNTICHIHIYRCLQFLNTIKWHVFWHCIYSFCEGFIVNGVINIIIVTLEKRYELTSQRSGMIASANDFGAAVLFIIVGYLGTHANKPRLMAAGMLLMSLGCLVFSLPQFVGDEYSFTISS